MADILPSIKIIPTDGHSRDGTKPDSPAPSSPTKDIVNGIWAKDGRPKSGSSEGGDPINIHDSQQKPYCVEIF